MIFFFEFFNIFSISFFFFSRSLSFSIHNKKRRFFFFFFFLRDWLRGALSTVDRDYGRFLNAAHHHIADTHVLHHLFSQIPHYHAQEATEAIKPVLGPYYARDDRGVARAVWEDFRECAVVSADASDAAREGKKAPLWFRRLV